MNCEGCELAIGLEACELTMNWDVPSSGEGKLLTGSVLQGRDSGTGGS